MDRKRKIIAALADLKQEIAGPIPVDIISKWTRGQKTPHEQKMILQPFEREGYLVCSDSAGLSRMTEGRSLLEVMHIVSRPKEVIYSMGRQIGGRGVGVWAADNSEMFYPSETVSAHQVLEAMAAAQKTIHQGFLQVGMAIHRGKFWEIGQGMFGDEASLVNAVAEEFAGAQEIVLSETVKADLSGELQQFLFRREDLQRFGKDFFTVNYDSLGMHMGEYVSSASEARNERDHLYPLPFEKEFFYALRKKYGSAVPGHLGPAANDDETEMILNSYCSERTVLLIKVYHRKRRLLLDQLTDWVVVNAILNEIAVKYDVKLIKSNGDLAIFVTENENEALALAEEVLISMVGSDDKVSIGLSKGEVLIFNLEEGGRDIAGGPINVASKISEDLDEKNTLYVEKSVKIPDQHIHKYEHFVVEKSGVVLQGMRYKEELLK